MAKAKGPRLTRQDGKTLIIRTFAELRDGAYFIKLFEQPVRGHKMFCFVSNMNIWRKVQKKYAWDDATQAGHHVVRSNTLVIEIEVGK